MPAVEINYKKKHKNINQMISDMSPKKPELKDMFKRNIRVNDEQVFVNRFNWYGLPEGMDSQFIERMIYYKYSLAMFYMESNDTIYILPYTFTEDIDVYGRWTNITPLPFTNGKSEGTQRAFIPGLVKKVVWAPNMDPDKVVDLIKNGAVILRDYTNDLSQMCIPRALLNEPVIDYEAEILASHRTSILNSTGVTAVRVNDPESQIQVRALNDQAYQAAVTGEKYLAAVSAIEMQNLDTSKTMDPQVFTTALASIDAYRLSLIGLDAGGITEKGQYVNNQELAAGQINTGSVLQDALMNRLKFCEIANSVFGLNMWCEVNQDMDIMMEQSDVGEDYGDISGDGSDNSSDSNSNSSNEGE